MESWEREYHVARIVAGKTKVRVRRQTLCVVHGGREQRFRAAEIYREARRDAERDGVLNDDGLLEILHRNEIWTDKHSEEFEAIVKDIDNGKVGLFENRLRSNARATIRAMLDKLRERHAELESARHCLDYVTVDGLAATARFRYLVASSLHTEDGRPYEGDDSIVEAVVDALASERLLEKDYREIARTDPWRSIWGSRNATGGGLLGMPAVDVGDEQRNLIVWSMIYDNVKEHPDCPNEDILADDDMLDGWMILQRRKREAQASSQQADSIGNPKIRNADEVFLMADTLDDARDVEKMNDVAASIAKKERMGYLKQKGEVQEQHMPDQMRRLRMEFSRLEAAKLQQAAGGRRG